jgi:hypothetical protein
VEFVPLHPETLLLRQVHPSFVQNGRPTSQVFRPTPKDEDRLSVDDGDKIDAKASWERFTGTLGFESIGVLAVPHAECAAQDLPVTADGEPYPEHCFLDFSGIVKKAAERKAKVLTSHAVERGWLFEPTKQS